MPKKGYVSPHKDQGFKTWLKSEGIEPNWLLALGKSGTIGYYRNKYNKSRRK